LADHSVQHVIALDFAQATDLSRDCSAKPARGRLVAVASLHFPTLDFSPSQPIFEHPLYPIPLLQETNLTKIVSRASDLPLLESKATKGR
jgi:hypothetical protein